MMLTFANLLVLLLSVTANGDSSTQSVCYLLSMFSTAKYFHCTSYLTLTFCCSVESKLYNTQHRKLIINGTKAVKGRYPYFVSLNHLCGGALIAPDIVLTAGHCKGRDHVYARVGTYSFHHDIKGYDYEEIRIVKQIRHPSFQWLGDDEFVHDFLLFKLRHPSSQPTIKLNRHLHIPAMNEGVIAMGVGNTDPDYDSRANTLMEVPLTAIPNEMCEESFDLDRNISYAHRIHPSMMCTSGGVNNERDAWYVEVEELLLFILDACLKWWFINF